MTERGPGIRRQRGYTLIEILIAAAVLLVSMTGLISMQLISIRITQDSYNRTLATSLAYEMTEYIRANCGLSGEVAQQYLGFTLCDAERRNSNDKRACALDEAADIIADPNSIIDDDLAAWYGSLNDSGLSNWYALIATQNGVFHVIVQWDDSRATETDADADEVKTSCLGDALPSPMEEVCLATIPCQ